MVGKILFTRIVKQLEKYLIKKNNFRLLGNTYELILFIPTNKYFADSKYTLLVSAKAFDNLDAKFITKELLSELKKILTIQEYIAISRVNILDSNSPFVKNIATISAYNNTIMELNDLVIGGVEIEYGVLITSVLSKLKENSALVLLLTNGLKMNAGIIKIEKNFQIIHYTGKGLREMWDPNMPKEKQKQAEELKNQSLEFLIENQYVSKTPLDDIEAVLN